MEATPMTTLDALLENMDFARALARRLVGDAAAADDLVQDAVLEAAQHPAAVRSSQKGLVATILRRGAGRRHRENSHRAAREEDAARQESTASAADLVLAAERQRDVVNAVIGLEEPYREVVLLRFFEGLAPREIVDRTGRSPAAVKKQLSRGLGMLRAQLETSYGSGAQWAVALVPLLGSDVASIVGATAVAAKSGATAAAAWGGGAKPLASLPASTAKLWLIGTVAAASVVLIALGRMGTNEPDPSANVSAAVPGLASPPIDDGAALAEPTTRLDQRGDAAPADEHPGLLAGAHDENPMEAVAMETKTATVRLYGADGKPIRNQPVRWSADRGGTVVEQNTSTDALGELALSLAAFESPIGGDWEVAGRAYDILSSHRAEGQPTSLLIGPAVRVSVDVTDENGTPVEGAHVQVHRAAAQTLQLRGELAAMFRSPMSRFPRGASGGPYDLGWIPAGNLCRIHVEAEGFRRFSCIAPVEDTLGLPVVLKRETARPMLGGYVRDRGGNDVEGAKVYCQYGRATTDAYGEFTLPCPKVGRVYGDPFLVVKSKDGRMARVESKTVLDAVAEDTPYLEVVLPDVMAELIIKLRTHGGQPARGYRALVFDGTRTDSQSAVMEQASFGSDPERAGVPVGEDGVTVISGLFDRPYRIRFVDPATLAIFDTEPLPPGEDAHEISLPEALVHPVVTGIVRDVTGAPVPGAKIIIQSDIAAPGHPKSMHMSRSDARSDEHGRFTLDNVSMAGARLTAHDGGDMQVNLVYVPVTSTRTSYELSMLRYHEVAWTIADPDITGVVAVNAAGERIDSIGTDVGSTSSAQVHRRGDSGQFPALRVDQRATGFELLRRDQPAERVPAHFGPFGTVNRFER